MPSIQHASSTVTLPPVAAWVEASVPYLADLSVKPVTYNPPVGTGVPRREGNYRDFKVRIHDARPIAASSVAIARRCAACTTITPTNPDRSGCAISCRLTRRRRG